MSLGLEPKTREELTLSKEQNQTMDFPDSTDIEFPSVKPMPSVVLSSLASVICLLICNALRKKWLAFAKEGNAVAHFSAKIGP